MTPDDGVITLEKNYVVTDSWTSLTTNLEAVTIDGKGHSIAGLTAPLLVDHFSQNLTIKNLTIKNSVINGNRVTGTGNGNGDDLRVGGFAGQCDMAAFSMTGCTAKNSVINADSSAGALVGQVMTNDGVDKTISNCKVENCKINFAENGSWRVGTLVGTVNGDGTLIIFGCSANGSELKMPNSEAVAPATTFYGRTVGDATVTME